MDRDELIPLLLNMLGRNDSFCQHQVSYHYILIYFISLSLSPKACLCIARIITHSPAPLEGDELNQFMGWVIAQLKHTVSVTIFRTLPPVTVAIFRTSI